MREIRFRAWDKELVVMRSWEYLRENNFNYNREWYRDNTGEDKPNDIWSDDDLTPEQFTGLKDRNGREIYEGDIVTEIWCGEERSTSIVERDAPNGGFNLRDLDGEYTEIDSNHEFNIIGNIHENPELLQGPAPYPPASGPGSPGTGRG